MLKKLIKKGRNKQRIMRLTTLPKMTHTKRGYLTKEQRYFERKLKRHKGIGMYEEKMEVDPETGMITLLHRAGQKKLWIPYKGSDYKDSGTWPRVEGDDLTMKGLVFIGGGGGGNRSGRGHNGKCRNRLVRWRLKQ
jgi:hypothetical protein